MDMTKTIYDLGLHETLKIDLNTSAVRVAGGWIYEYYEINTHGNRVKFITCTFVPYNDEFNEKTKEVRKLKEMIDNHLTDDGSNQFS